MIYTVSEDSILMSKKDSGLFPVRVKSLDLLSKRELSSLQLKSLDGFISPVGVNFVGVQPCWNVYNRLGGSLIIPGNFKSLTFDSSMFRREVPDRDKYIEFYVLGILYLSRSGVITLSAQDILPFSDLLEKTGFVYDFVYSSNNCTGNFTVDFSAWKDEFDVLLCNNENIRFAFFTGIAHYISKLYYLTLTDAQVKFISQLAESLSIPYKVSCSRLTPVLSDPMDFSGMNVITSQVLYYSKVVELEFNENSSLWVDGYFVDRQ